MATSRKPKKRKATTQRNLSPKKGPKGGAVATLPNLSSSTQISSSQTTAIPLNTILGPGGQLVP